MRDRVTVFAPGRVNLIGEHTDYNEGLALPFAIARGDRRRLRASGDHVHAVAVDLGGEDTFELARPRRARGWRAFVRGAVAELQRAGCRCARRRLRITGGVPRGAGLSSSAALEVALTLALIASAGRPASPIGSSWRRSARASRTTGSARRPGCSTSSRRCSVEPERALRIDFRSLDVRPVPLRARRVQRSSRCDSGDRHALAAGSGYNERRRGVRASPASRSVSTACAMRRSRRQRALPSPLDRRVRHVITENERVDATVEALAGGDMRALGRLLDASHASLRDCYEVSTPAVEAAVGMLKHAGALGARIVGGGFGGHVLGLMPPDAALPDGAREVRPGQGARVIE